MRLLPAGEKVSPGPANYAVDYKSIGQTEQDMKITIKSRMTSRYWPGLHSSLEAPCEAPGMFINLPISNNIIKTSAIKKFVSSSLNIQLDKPIQ